MATTGLTAGSGFVFWVVVARLYPVDDVGRATSLISAVSLLSYFSLLGLSNTLIRFLPTTRRRAEYVGSSLLTVTLGGAAIALGFALVSRTLSPQLSFINDAVVHLLVFVALATGAAVNLLTDSVFVALRAAGWNLLINGVLMSVAKLTLPVFLVTAGALGIFVASGFAALVAAIVSVVVIGVRLKIPVRPRFSADVLRQSIRYSLGTYASSSLNLVPQLVIPILVLNRLGAAAAAAYFVAFQIANLINAVSYAVGEALFAEGSHEEHHLRALMRRSALVMLSINTPATLLAVVLAYPVLRVFGDSYATAAYQTLVVLALSSFAVAFNTWTNVLLKVKGKLALLTVANVVFAGATTVLAFVGTAHGPLGVAVAWGIGNLACGLVAGLGLLPRRRTGQS